MTKRFIFYLRPRLDRKSDMVSETGLYETLGVSPDSEATVIKKAYKQLALKYHPDKNPSTHAEERFKGLTKF